MKYVKAADIVITQWMANHALLLLRWSLGLVFFWFGVLKFFPEMSPAQDLALRTINVLTMGLIPDSFSLSLLAGWECVIGAGLLWGKWLRATLLLMYAQMLGTLTPILFFPEEVFAQFPYALTMEGQYIVKNLVIISAGVVLGATVRGGKIVAEPRSAARA